MRQELFKYLFAGVMAHLAERHGDPEAVLKEIGYDMGKKLLILERKRQEDDLEALLYWIAYVLLPSLYETDRVLERSSAEHNTFFITENNPLMNKYISLPGENSAFTCDAIFAGVIESILVASEFRATVTAHNVESIPHPDRVIYVIKINKKTGNIVEI